MGPIRETMATIRNSYGTHKLNYAKNQNGQKKVSKGHLNLDGILD